MRESLFRGKRFNNGKWEYGWLCEYPFGRWPLKCAIIPKEEAYDGCHHFERIDPETVGQYTGRNDKNGKRIFEGDIVKTKYGRLCKVVWHNTQAAVCFYLDPLDAEHPRPSEWDVWHTENLEVIGNIYDNPELLKKEVAE